ncbi:MAG: hypothetical protein Q9207_000622 [Kuettlingeria erythrocarpa]
MEDTVGGNLVELMERATLCVSGPNPGVAAHRGDEGFREVVAENFDVAENNAVEELVQLKKRLREASTYDFWSLLMEGMTEITGGQYGFVTKRILVDDQDTAVEMPPIGEPGSCLLGVAFYYNDGREFKDMHRDLKYLAYGAPCHHMKHDKVFLIPNKLQEFILNNPNNFPFPTDAYLGVPLFLDGKCFGHFGMMWTKHGLAQKRLSWAYIEMLMHALEDVILERLEAGMGFSRGPEGEQRANIIPAEAVTAQQSLKPYARSLSHELRTPMQGVVGMLDVMHATVQESLEGQSDATTRKIFKTLRENIEVVQDSSRRAVEAADNVVHAYDLNMQIPDTPVPQNDDESVENQLAVSGGDRRPNIVIEGNSISFKRSKRRRTTSAEVERPPHKHRVLQSEDPASRRRISPHTARIRNAVEESDIITRGQERRGMHGKKATPATLRTPEAIDEMALDTSEPESAAATPGIRHTKVRELLQLTVNESLRVGGRPESAMAEDTDGGELIDVRTRNSNGKISRKSVEWSVDPQVPDTIYVDERDLTKLISCVFLNAIKFTETGKIKLRAALSPKSKFLVINVEDTGPGIPQAFIPYLFKAFSREDDSLTRQKEGLGLGLLVAKGLARKIGGDLVCVRSDTQGPRRGTEFELRVPITPSDSQSRTSSPTGTPTPSRSSLDRLPMLSQRGRETKSLDRRRTPRSKASPATARTPDPTSFPRAITPLLPSSSRKNSLPQAQASPTRRASTKKTATFDRNLAKKYPLNFLVAEDNKINRKLLVNMLSKLGYSNIHEAHDGVEAVRQMSVDRRTRSEKPIDVILMDLWMPTMDGYEATEKILAMDRERRGQLADDDRARKKPGVTILAVSADVTDSALERASEVGMEGFMTKPYKLMDLERLIVEYCAGDAATKQ